MNNKVKDIVGFISDKYKEIDCIKKRYKINRDKEILEIEIIRFLWLNSEQILKEYPFLSSYQNREKLIEIIKEKIMEN